MREEEEEETRDITSTPTRHLAFMTSPQGKNGNEAQMREGRRGNTLGGSESGAEVITVSPVPSKYCGGGGEGREMETDGEKRDGVRIRETGRGGIGITEDRRSRESCSENKGNGKRKGLGIKEQWK